MPRCCGEASIHEARTPCNCRAPCIQVIKSKPIKKDWTLWCGVNFKTGFCFESNFGDDSLCATNYQHLPWGMTEEMMMRIVREH
eukprot:1962196-Ditylum_brightwellii.AAC.1